MTFKMLFNAAVSDTETDKDYSIAKDGENYTVLPDNDRQKAVDAMTETISKQIKRGAYISNHLLSNAVDIRKTANFKVLNNAVIRVGGRVVGELDHYHLELH